MQHFYRNFRRKNFKESEINSLKWKFFQFIQDECYEDNAKLQLNEQEQNILLKSFNWLIGKEIDINLNKGLFFTGDYGTGKSVVMKGILRFINAYYTHNVLQNGIASPIYVTSSKLAHVYINKEEKQINRLKTTSILFVDDIGHEPIEISLFGAKVSPFEDIVMDRYDMKKLIMLTSNLNLEQIGEKYGEHIKERIKQMTYVIEFKGKSFRK